MATSRESGEDIILRVANTLTQDAFEFTVEVAGIPYDVYRFTEKGIIGQLAFAKIDGKFVVAMFRPGRLPADKVAQHIKTHKDDPA